MHNVAVIGAGKIGSSITRLLAGCGDYQVTVVDKNSDFLTALNGLERVVTVEADIHQQADLDRLLRQQSAMVSACAYHENVKLAEAALRAGISYFDLTEDVATADAISALSTQSVARQVFVPQCGLAPGFISILANSLVQQFDCSKQSSQRPESRLIDNLTLRVGALPEFPTNQMMYNLTWSTEGLINEYCNPCIAIKQGQKVQLQPLEGLETFSLDGIEYEAFNTSGGLGSLCDSLGGQVDSLSYKTIRYKGHRYLMNFLINDLKLGERRQLLKKIFENAVAVTKQDVVLIMVSATGQINGQFSQLTDSRKVYHRQVDGEHWGAIQITTAASLCAVLDLYYQQQTPQQGLVLQEQIELQTFLDNRFGRYYCNLIDKAVGPSAAVMSSDSALH
ncbi:MAG: saccharopine dehydrogenase NADP-binding domain-containing protein [Immundisolibacteraceae bacterium]|nr:saccharopine dehydrogenase NADP-binding domain-containing protein [Immundisolibacteraceae bacterium]